MNAPAHYVKLANTPEEVGKQVGQAAAASPELQSFRQRNPLLYDVALAASAVLAYRALTHTTEVPSNPLSYPQTGHIAL